MATEIYLNGKRVAGSAPAAAVRAPFDGTLIAQVEQAGPDQVQQAIAGMFRVRNDLSRMPAWKRAQACARVHQGLTERAEVFAKSIAHEAGKPIRTARGEVARAISTFKLAAEEATRIPGEQLPVDIDPRGNGYWALVERFPIGPCAFITPFNFPLNLVAHKVAPAIAAGCPFIVKPSERTPLTALLLGELLAEAALPEGTWSVLPCDRDVARPLVTDDRIKLLSFTGSPEVGFKMKADAGKKQVVLELGNNSAVLLEPDTNLADAVPRIVSGAFGYAGQSCISVQRIYLHQAIAGEATRLLVAAAQNLVVGDPLAEQTDVGPVIDAAAADRITRWIASSGGELLCGGRREGSLLWPALLRGVQADSPLLTQEAFGPVAILETYRDFDDVLDRIDAGRFGLQAGLFVRDIHKVRKAFTRPEMGGVVINDVPTTRIDNMPYGGVKDSGLGREGVKYALEHMTERRVLLVRDA
jgi:acyl-CoA reductase-like NAD-dependent aldehyde dehydrogenase